jgi:hypothetical protein
MKDTKPVVGSLVRIDREIFKDLQPDEVSLAMRIRDQVGLVIECVGTRCHILWQDNSITRPARTVLEVIN